MTVILFITICQYQAVAQVEVEETYDLTDTAKITIVHVYTDWCGLCKLMEHDVYSDDEVAAYLTANFKRAKWNPEKALSYLAAEWDIKAFPTILFMNPDGSIFYKYAGVLNKSELLDMAGTVLDNSDRDLSEVKLVRSFKKRDFHGRNVLIQDSIQQLIQVDRLDRNSVEYVIDNLRYLDESTFMSSVRKLYSSPMNFKHRRMIRDAIQKVYARILKSDEVFAKERWDAFLAEMPTSIHPQKQ